MKILRATSSRRVANPAIFQLKGSWANVSLSAGGGRTVRSYFVGLDLGSWGF